MKTQQETHPFGGFPKTDLSQCRNTDPAYVFFEPTPLLGGLFLNQQENHPAGGYPKPRFQPHQPRCPKAPPRCGSSPRRPRCRPFFGMASIRWTNQWEILKTTRPEEKKDTEKMGGGGQPKSMLPWGDLKTGCDLFGPGTPEQMMVFWLQPKPQAGNPSEVTTEA